MKNKKKLNKKISAEVGMGTILLIAIIISGVFYLKSKKESSLAVSVNNQVSVRNQDDSYLSPVNNNKNSEDMSVPFQYAKNIGFYGTLTLTGYLDVQQRICKPDEMCAKTVDYASIIITDTDNKLIYDFINNNKGNSYVGINSIGLGCYEKETQRIYSVNFGDDGKVENVILKDDVQKLLESSNNNTISIQLTKPTSEKIGGGAPECYSHFRSFKILN